jgi:hypothetical protein
LEDLHFLISRLKVYSNYHKCWKCLFWSYFQRFQAMITLFHYLLSWDEGDNCIMEHVVNQSGLPCGRQQTERENEEGLREKTYP